MAGPTVILEWLMRRPWDPAVILMLGTAATLVFSTLCLVCFRRKPATPGALAVPEIPPNAAPVPPPPPEPAEQREQLRRSGTWLKVYCRNPQTAERYEGHVVDHTPHGVGLTTFHSVAVGDSLEVRGANVPGSIPWVSIVVRSCQPLGGNQWRIGGQTADLTLWETLQTYI